MRKKIIALALMLSFVAALALFAGCSTGGEEASAPNADEVAVESVSLDKSELSLAVGQTGTLIVTVAPQNATKKTVIWTSSDATVATVSADGTVTAHGEGKTVITVKWVYGDRSATCTVNVTA